MFGGRRLFDAESARFVLGVLSTRTPSPRAQALLELAQR